MNARNFQILIRSLRLLWRYRLRSTLVVLSAGLGVAGVICSVNYGAGGNKQILDQIRRMGTNVLIVTPAQSRATAGRARTGAPVTTLIDRDYAAIRRDVIARTRSSAVVARAFWTKAGDLSKNATVVGCEPDFFAIKDWPLLAGDFFDSAQERLSSRVALLGHSAAVDLFGNDPGPGKRIMINRVPFTVVGVLAERGQGLDVANEDSQVYVPLNTAMRRLMSVDHFDAIVVEIDAMNRMDAAATQIRSLLRPLHHIRANRPEDFQIRNQKSLVDTQITAARRLEYFLQWIAASSLLVSGFGIIAITWTAVRERTGEMGVRRALGATKADIFLQVLLETATLAVIGVVLGLAVSWPLSRQISNSTGLPFVFERESAVLAFFAAATLNLIFAILPARKAASVNPVRALRYE